MSERRESRRQKSFLRGFVSFDRRRGVMSCLVRDLSDEGARIILSQGVTIPDMISLYIPQREKTYNAQVQWRRGDEIGLGFIEGETGTPATPKETELMERVAQLETEITALKRTIKRLRRERSDDGEFEAA
jgi:hypothetical protein